MFTLSTVVFPKTTGKHGGDSKLNDFKIDNVKLDNPPTGNWYNNTYDNIQDIPVAPVKEKLPGLVTGRKWRNLTQRTFSHMT